MSSNLWVQEECLEVKNRNEDKEQRISYGQSEVYESGFDSIGALFLSLTREYGRCISKVYIDKKEGGPPKQIGWVFEKRAKYTDCDKTYLQETWVSIHTAAPIHTIKYNYRYL